MRSKLVVSISRIAVFGLLGIVLGSCSSSTEPVVRQGVIAAPGSAVDMGSVMLGRLSTTTVYIRNSGNDTLTINSVSVLNSAVFSAAFTAALPLKLAASDSAGLTITYHPDDIGAATAMVTMSVQKARDSVTSFNVNGSGTAYRIQLLNSYTYDENDYDFSDKLTGIIPVTLQVVDTDATWSIKQGCIHMLSDGGADSYYKFETNGDISFFFPSDPNANRADSGWVTLPFGSKSTMAVQVDSGSTIVTYMGVPGPLTYADSVRYIGADTLTLNGELLHVQHAQFFVKYSTFGSDLPLTIDFYFSPRLGFFARQEFRIVIPPLFQSQVKYPPHWNQVITSDSLR